MLAVIRRRLTPTSCRWARSPGGQPSRDVRRVPARRLRLPGAARPSRWPSTTTRSLRHTSTGGSSTEARLQAEIAAQTRAGVLHPVFAGSAATGAGVADLMAGIGALLPATAPDSTRRAFRPGVQGRAGRGWGEGGIRPDVRRLGRCPDSCSTARRPLGQGRRASSCSSRASGSAQTRLVAGQIGRLHGLGAVRVGDGFGTGARPRSTTSHRPRSRRRSTAVRPDAGPGAARGASPAGRPGPPDRRRTPARTGCPRCRSTVVCSKRCWARPSRRSTASRWSSLMRACCTSSDPRRRDGGRAAQHRVEPVPGHHRSADRTGSARLRARASSSTPRRTTCRCTCSEAPRASRQRSPSTSRRALARGWYGWQVTDCVVTLFECGYSIRRRAAVQTRPAQHVIRLPEGDAGRGRAGAGAGPDGGLRASAAGTAGGTDRDVAARPARGHSMGRRAGRPDRRGAT